MNISLRDKMIKPEVYLAVLTEELGEVARSIIEGDSDNYPVSCY